MSDDSTVRVPLTQGRFALIDKDDADDILQFKWQVGGNGYVHRRYMVNKVVSTEMLHRRITNCPQGMTVDHINHNPLDNRRNNLRIATQAQNNANQKRIKGASGLKGVRLNCIGKKWVARITVNRREMHLGSFPTPEEAARAYDAAAIEAYGEFACLNFTEEHRN